MSENETIEETVATIPQDVVPEGETEAEATTEEEAVEAVEEVVE